MPRRLAPPLGVVLVLLVPLASARGVLAPPTVQSLAEDVAALAAPDMEGRRSGTPGGDRAARRIAEWLAAAGLRPGGAHGTYFQPFVIERAARLGTATALEILSPAPRRLEVGRDFESGCRPERSEEHTSELQSPCNLVCRLLLEKKKKRDTQSRTGAM